MASSSHSSHPNYEVFLSFRGEDTRYNFTSHLLQALKEKGIGVFFDEKDLEMGDELSPTLLGAIAASKIYIIILSKGYASSSWCLTELSEIMKKCKERSKQVVPVFYHVNPSDVRKYGGSFEESFSLYQKEKPNELVEKWKAAFTQVGNLKGSHIIGDRPEPEEIKNIVEDVIMKLDCKSLSYTEGLVGIDDRKEHIKSLLHIGEEGICVVGIWGMGGIGKTTLADVVYNEVSKTGQFDSFYFLRNIREESRKDGGIFSLRDELFSKILKEPNFHIDTLRIGSKFTMDRLGRIKVLVVLDDIADLDQYEILVCSHNPFGSGSRIIITSRDKQVLKTCRANEIYKVEELNYVDSLQLFSLYAFKQNHPADDFKDLSKKALLFARGVPIALKVLGSALLQKEKDYWGSVLNTLNDNPNQKIQRILKISFDGLDDIEKNIFLDITCILKWCEKKHLVNVLDSCYAGAARYGIENLVDKCLVSGDVKCGDIWIHDLLQEMGMDIVRKESKDPGKRSRLWDAKDICAVFKNNTGTESIEGVILDMSQIDPLQLCPTIFQKMIHLRVLKIYYAYGRDKNPCNKLLPTHSDFESPYFPLRWGQYLWKTLSSKIKLTSLVVESLPNTLRYLQWDYYPSKSLPLNFNPRNLIELNLRGGKMEQLWHGDHQDIVNLRRIDLRDCAKLRKIPNLSGAVKLEELQCHGCSSLEELPSLSHLTSLKRLELGGTSSLKLKHTVIEHISKLESLDFLDLRCSGLEELPLSTGNIPNKPEELILSGTWIQNLPNTISTVVLSYLNITALNFGPSSFSRFKSFDRLDIDGCKSLKILLELPPGIVDIDAEDCTSLEIVSFADQHYLFELSFVGIYDLNFSGCLKLNHDSFANIVANAMLKVGSLAKQSADEYRNKGKIVSLREVVCCLPGYEISDEFEHQSLNSSMNLKIDPNRYGGIRYLVFTLCLAIYPNVYYDHPLPEFDLICKGHLKAKGGEINKRFDCHWPINYRGSNAFNHPHVGIWFCSDLVHEDIDYEEASFKFDLVKGIRTREVIEEIKVKKCGVHVSYVEYSDVEKIHADLTTQIRAAGSKRKFSDEGEVEAAASKRFK